MTTEENYQFWQNHFKEWKQQGVGISSYCKSNFLPPAAFQEWTKKFGILEDVAYIPLKIEAQTQTRIQFGSSFAEVKIINNSTQSLTANVDSSSCPYKIIFSGFEIQCARLPEPGWLMELQRIIGRSVC